MDQSHNAILLIRYRFIATWETMCLYLYFLDIDNFNPGNILHLKNNNE